MYTKWKHLSIVAWLFLTSCGTWIGNPKNPGKDSGDSNKGTVELDIEGKDSSTSLVASVLNVNNGEGDNIGTLELSDVLIVLRDIILISSTEFSLNEEEGEEEESEEDEEEEDEEDEEEELEGLEFDGPFLADLLVNKIYPTPETIQTPEGTYSGVSLQAYGLHEEDARSIGLPSNHKMVDSSILIEGVYKPSDGGSYAFEMTFDLDESFQLNEENGFKIEGGKKSKVKIKFDFSKWFDFSNENSNPDGVDFDDLADIDIDLDKESTGAAEEIREVIKENIFLSADVDEEDYDEEDEEDEEEEEEDEEEEEEERF